MNFFKKALVASAVVASFGAAADATVSSTALQLSEEGILGGLTATAQELVFDVVVGTDTPAASTITLTFDNTVDLNGLTDGAVTNAVGTGVGTVGAGASGLIFNYGTGSFTFDDVVVTDNNQALGEQDTLSFKVNLGNALTAGSAFRVTLGDGAATGVAIVSGEADLAYQSVDAADALIENGAGTVAEEVKQFAFSVTTPFSDLIDRTTTTVFTDTVSPAAASETAVFSFTNNANLAAAITNTNAVVTLEGNFDGLVTADYAVTTVGATGSAAPAVPLVADAANAVVTSVGSTADTITITLLAANTSLQTAVAGGVTTLSVPFVSTAAAVLPETGTIDASVVLTNSTSTLTTYALATDLDAGEWKIDATIINVPYFPVGYTGVQSTIQLANEGSADVDVIVTAIDNDGMTYGPVNLDTTTAFASDLPGETVSKLSDTFLMDLLSVSAGTSLSVTFNIDANEGVVNGYAYTQKPGTGRSEVSTSQQRGN